MELQRRKEDYEEPFVSKNFVKATIIGAIFGAVVFLVRRLIKRLGPVHPPIIIKSTEEADVPVNIESRHSLDESNSSVGDIAGQPTMLYTMKEFDTIKYVGIYGENIGPDPPPREYQSATGLEVKMWLQKFEFNQWQWEVDGPHLLIDGTTPGFQLTCPELTASSDSGDYYRPSERSLDNIKTWRIGKVQVGKAKPIETSGYLRLEVRFDDHFDDE